MAIKAYDFFLFLFPSCLSSAGSFCTRACFKKAGNTQKHTRIGGASGCFWCGHGNLERIPFTFRYTFCFFFLLLLFLASFLFSASYGVCFILFFFFF